MLFSKLYVPTLKETPAEAEVVSHKLLLRAGMIRKLTSGIYTYMPLGLRAVNKVAQIVREEMNRAGAQEISMPMVQPADLWQESGRWDFYGKELLRLHDRHGRDYCLGPTHEEVVTDLVRGEVRSYRQLPLNLYQIQTKFRDEIRPRFGLMRGREFIMKDAYSFDKDEEGANQSYQAMYDAYTRIFDRLGLVYRAVSADSGAIGGSFSHEFMVLATTGEDTLAVCTACSYAANLEKAEIRPGSPCTSTCAPYEQVATPGRHTVEDVAGFLAVSSGQVMKTLLFDVDGQAVAVLVRGDHEVNDVKLKNLLGATSVELASPEQVQQWTGAPVGFAGPVGLKVDALYADLAIAEATDFVCGANVADTHLVHVDPRRDIVLSTEATASGYADLRSITLDDPCPACGAPITMPEGIEVGHVFKLGTKYSQAMNAIFLDENGREQVLIMGCYGIGVSRVVAACIEQNHDEKGMIFPPSIAPFEITVLAMSTKDEQVMALGHTMHDWLEAQGIDTLFDDRDERPGVKFNEADLLGSPMQIVIGGKGLERGVLEVKNRRSGEKRELPVDDWQNAITTWRDA
ncbi:MAG: proline--tRNA ligase, partial [Desulfovibrionales bacterium]|nr:proline--tRNA ligase [Desulfovibrionales bacterium]